MPIKTFSVYMHIFPNGKRYIGITSQKPVEKRWYSTGSGYRKCPKMWKAIQKYGWDNVEHIILYEELPQGMAEALEIQLIKQYDSIANGYNVDRGGNVVGSHSEETKAKISAGNKGKLVSEETREKLRLINKQNVGEKNAFYGHHHTDDTKHQHSLFMQGNQYNKGHHHSEEFKKWKSKQMSEAYSNGKNPRCKRVIAINTENGIIKEFYSLRQASSESGINLSCLFNGIKKEKEINGYLWRYCDG